MTTDATIDATAVLLEVTQRHGIDFGIVVAETGLWASPKVHQYLLAENGTGAYYPGVRRYHPNLGEKVGDTIDGVRLDNNSYANTALKQALDVSTRGFETCHTWPRTCYDPRYHTVIANLVLLPRALAGLSDHDSAILAILQYHSYELYAWHPTEEPTPTKPPDYPTTWREPCPFTPAIAKTLSRRRRRLG